MPYVANSGASSIPLTGQFRFYCRVPRVLVFETQKTESPQFCVAAMFETGNVVTQEPKFDFALHLERGAMNGASFEAFT